MISPEVSVKTAAGFTGHHFTPKSCQRKMEQHLFHIHKKIPWNQNWNELENNIEFLFSSAKLYGMLRKMSNSGRTAVSTASSENNGGLLHSDRDVQRWKQNFPKIIQIKLFFILWHFFPSWGFKLESTSSTSCSHWELNPQKNYQPFHFVTNKKTNRTKHRINKAVEWKHFVV